MSSLFSDPPFGRGTTLLSGEAIELDAANFPLAGREVAGMMKAFPDQNPGTGTNAIKYSNRLVYCVACRYMGASSINTLASNYADRGKAYVLSADLSQFSTAASATDVANGRVVGLLDEYLQTPVRQYDIVWLVVKGPAQAAKASAGHILPSTGYEVGSTGFLAAKGTQANLMAGVMPQLSATGFSDTSYPLGEDATVVTQATAASAANTAGSASVTLAAANAGIKVGMAVSGTNVPDGTTVSAISSTTLTLSQVTGATAIGNSVTLSFYWGQTSGKTLFRVALDGNNI
jgi:hypothetical protein